MTLDDYARSLRESLRERWCREPGAPGVLVLSGISDRTYLASVIRRGLATCEELQNERMKGFVLRVGSGPAECWVEAGLSRKRHKSVFGRFILREYAIELGRKESTDDPYEVDHAHPCISVARKADAEFVLLTPIRKRINASWGTIESYLANDNGPAHSVQVMSYLNIAKLMGLKAPAVSASIDPPSSAAAFLHSLRQAGLIDPQEQMCEVEGIARLIAGARASGSRLRKPRAKRSVNPASNWARRINNHAPVE